MKKPQWITIAVAVGLITTVYFWGRTIPRKSTVSPQSVIMQIEQGITSDSILTLSKKQLNPEQVVRLNTLENSISRGNVKEQQLNVYHQLAHFWADSALIFEPYAFYESEAARLENSEKSLNFAARLFLENLQSDNEVQRRKWKALQANNCWGNNSK